MSRSGAAEGPRGSARSAARPRPLRAARARPAALWTSGLRGGVASAPGASAAALPPLARLCGVSASFRELAAPLRGGGEARDFGDARPTLAAVLHCRDVPLRRARWRQRLTL